MVTVNGRSYSLSKKRRIVWKYIERGSVIPVLEISLPLGNQALATGAAGVFLLENIALGQPYQR